MKLKVHHCTDIGGLLQTLVDCIRGGTRRFNEKRIEWLAVVVSKCMALSQLEFIKRCFEMRYIERLEIFRALARDFPPHSTTTSPR